jgi:CDP-glucose 4,6-dehydratase
MNLIKLKKFWKNKKVFITGHSGFKGTWLCIFLNILGAKIYGFSLKEEKKSLFSSLKKNLKLEKSINGDIKNFKKLKNILQKVNPHIIFHFAAQSIVYEGYRDSKNTFETNINGTNNLLHSLNGLSNLKSVVIATSDKVYNNSKKKLFTEKDILDGDDPYSLSKVCKELIVKGFKQSFYFKKLKKVSISTVRAGNIVGGGDHCKNRLIPDIINAKKVLTIRNPNNTRPWQYVLDALYGYILIAEKQYLKKINSSSWNLGPNSSNIVSVNKIVKIFSLYLKIPKIKFVKKIKFRENKYLGLNSNRAKIKLKWKPKYNIKLTIKKTIQWYKMLKKLKDPKKVCECQILEYINK